MKRLGYKTPVVSGIMLFLARRQFSSHINKDAWVVAVTALCRRVKPFALEGGMGWSAGRCGEGRQRRRR